VQHKPERAPFQIGDWLEYVGETSIEAPARSSDETADKLMRPGMKGIVVASLASRKDPVSGETQPAYSRIKFYDNGYEFSINARNKYRFKKFG
jgi:hypothetical protein